MKKRLLILSLFSAVIILALFNNFATYSHAYYNTAWADLLSHFLGGLSMALIGAFVFFVLIPYYLNTDSLSRYTIIFLFALIAGLVWEVFEIMFGLSIPKVDAIDTLSDLSMDILGSIAGIIYLRYKIWLK
jgi:hypothetical protein